MNSIPNRIAAFVKLGTFLSQFSNNKIQKKEEILFNELFFDGFKHQIKLAQENNDDNITLFGTGTPLRQFVYAEDLANIIKLTIENDELPEKYWFVLELMTLNHEHNKSYSKSVNKTPFSFSDNENGILDIAFTVDDINSVSDYVISHGGGLIGGVMKAAVGYPALHRYLLDPEGNVLHVAENLE